VACRTAPVASPFSFDLIPSRFFASRFRLSAVATPASPPVVLTEQPLVLRRCQCAEICWGRGEFCFWLAVCRCGRQICRHRAAEVWAVDERLSRTALGPWWKASSPALEVLLSTAVFWIVIVRLLAAL